MNQKPTIFLDIDGVLNSVQYAVSLNRYNTEWNPYRDECCKIALSNLERVLEEVPNLEIVISSTWRKSRSVEDLQALFKLWGFSKPEIIVGKTPVSNREIRGKEIQQYIELNNISNYCIIDDDSDMLDSQKSRFVQTNGRHGFMWDDYNKVVELLKETK